jgi:hypothetical protein
MEGYKGNLAYGKNGTSYRFSGNTEPRFGRPDLITFADLMSSDKTRRKTNPLSGLSTPFNIHQVGWVNETSSIAGSRLPARENLKRDYGTQPRLCINSKEQFDQLVASGVFISKNIPKDYYALKYPYDQNLVYPYFTQSSILKRQIDLNLTVNSFNNIGHPNADATPFGLSSDTIWGKYLARNTSFQMINSYMITKIYSEIGSKNSFIFSDIDYSPKFVRINNIEKLNIRYPLGPSFSNLLKMGLIKGTPKEDLFSGYMEKRKGSGCGI